MPRKRPLTLPSPPGEEILFPFALWSCAALFWEIGLFVPLLGGQSRAGVSPAVWEIGLFVPLLGEEGRVRGLLSNPCLG